MAAHRRARRLRVVGAIAIAIAIAGCGRDRAAASRTSSTASDEPGAPRAAALPLRPPCPSHDFRTFLAAFAEDSTLQRRHTRFPLLYGVFKDRDDGPIVPDRQLPVDSVEWPVLPSARQRAEYRLRLDPARDSNMGDRMYGIVARPSTDAYRVVYTFMRKAWPGGMCWQLVRVAHESP